MLFSIIIPNYNNSKYIKRCLDSVFNQTLPKTDYEVIFIDDASTDNSLEVIQSYDVKLFKNSQNMGAGGARNKGLDNAIGKYVVFLDSDDNLFDNTVLAKLASIINDQDVIYLPYRVIRTDDIIQDNINSEKINLKERIKADRCLGVVSKCWSRELLKDVRFVEGVAYEDVGFCINAYCKVKTEGYLDDMFLVYNRVPDSQTISDLTVRKQIDVFTQIFHLFYLIEKYPQYKNELLYRIKMDDLHARLDKIINVIESGSDHTEIKRWN